VLDRAKTAPFIAIDTLIPGHGVLVISPHPDDETLGCGQALSAAAHAGHGVGIVLMTQGEGSHPNSSAYPGEALKKLRVAEFMGALNDLVPHGGIDVLQLNLPDAGDENSDISDSVVSMIVDLALRIRASCVWTTWRGDPHCDHVLASALAAKVSSRLNVPLWSYLVWGRFGQRDVPAGLFRFADDQAARRKIKAMSHYKSQLTSLIEDDPEGFRMPDQLVAHFASHPELFARD
jgi:LmbE family N-acetylglucosaminyl deacetylase